MERIHPPPPPSLSGLGKQRPSFPLSLSLSLSPSLSLSLSLAHSHHGGGVVGRVARAHGPPLRRRIHRPRRPRPAPAPTPRQPPPHLSPTQNPCLFTASSMRKSNCRLCPLNLRRLKPPLKPSLFRSLSPAADTRPTSGGRAGRASTCPPAHRRRPGRAPWPRLPRASHV